MLEQLIPDHRPGAPGHRGTGGPGESGIEYLRADISSLKNLNQRFDLVSWDPRGVAGSTPVACVDGPQMDAYLSIDAVLDDPQEKQDAIQADKDFAAGCQRRSGDLLPFMDSASTARDMDQIRASLGDAKLTYLGFSYGTVIGAVYAQMFPDHVGRLVLDSPVDLSASPLDELRANERRPRAVVALEDVPPLEVVDAPMERLEAIDAVWRAVEGLSVDLKMALLLRDIVGLSYTEFADSLEITLATVKWRIYKAREDVQLSMAREGITFGDREQTVAERAAAS